MLPVYNQYSLPRQTSMSIQPRHWAYPPTWFIRTLKTIFIITQIIFFVLILTFVTIRAQRPGVITLPDATDDYVQRMGICNHLEPLPMNTTNVTAITIHRACTDLEAMEAVYYTRRRSVVNEFEAEFILNGADICEKDTDVVLLIHSYHDYLDRRQAIRETWGGAVANNKWPMRTFPEKVKIVFMFGVHLNKTFNDMLLREDDKYHDIVQGDFIDSYKNMTFKSLLGLKWVTRHCSMVNNMIKSDDDMIINFPHLLRILKGTDMSWSIMGPLNIGSKVLRNKSKWSIPKSIFPFYYFPPYESGSAYVIHIDLVRPLLEYSDYVPHLWIDDVYITGILGRILNVRHKRQPGFAYWINKVPKSCDIIRDKIITGTKVKPKIQYDLWKGITDNITCSDSS